MSDIIDAEARAMARQALDMSLATRDALHKFEGILEESGRAQTRALSEHSRTSSSAQKSIKDELTNLSLEIQGLKIRTVMDDAKEAGAAGERAVTEAGIKESENAAQRRHNQFVLLCMALAAMSAVYSAFWPHSTTTTTTTTTAQQHSIEQGHP